MASAIALVDYDNVRPTQRETNPDFLEMNLTKVTEGVCSVVKMVMGEAVNELVLRLYGGWTQLNGRYSERGDWLLRRISAARGLHQGIRVLPEMALSIEQRRACRLRGLYRPRPGGTEQKMVDSMICVDLLHFARCLEGPIFVASDDDDMVPALLAAVETDTRSVCVLRHRGQGAASNDDHLKSCRVRVELLPPDLRRK